MREGASGSGMARRISSGMVVVPGGRVGACGEGMEGPAWLSAGFDGIDASAGAASRGAAGTGVGTGTGAGAAAGTAATAGAAVCLGTAAGIRDEGGPAGALAAGVGALVALERDCPLGLAEDDFEFRFAMVLNWIIYKPAEETNPEYDRDYRIQAMELTNRLPRWPATVFSVIKTPCATLVLVRRPWYCQTAQSQTRGESG